MFLDLIMPKPFSNLVATDVSFSCNMSFSVVVVFWGGGGRGGGGYMVAGYLTGCSQHGYSLVFLTGQLNMYSFFSPFPLLPPCVTDAQ